MNRGFGIDLGTTNSAICTLDEYGRPELIPNAEGQKITPSVVQIRADGSTLVGELAKREVVLERENTAQFFKRDIGTGAAYEYHGKSYTPVDLSAEVLKKLKADAEAALGGLVRDVVITVPAYFRNSAREETRQAGELAGLNVLQIINEPTAASIAYGFSRGSTDETVLVYDLGGGTFDISLVRVAPNLIEVIGTDGNHALGGKDWDDRLLQYVAAEFTRRHHSDPLEDPVLFQELLVRVEDAKKVLSSAQKAVVAVSHAGVRDRIEITRAAFEEITADLLAQTEMLIEGLLRDANFDLDGIGSVLMVGGSTRMPACKQLVGRITGKDPRLTINPDECVAMGAALQAAMHGNAVPMLGSRRVQDVMSHSMGMIAETEAGDRFVNSILIPRNLPIPARQIKSFRVRTSPRRAASLSVYVTQGENDDPADCSYVGKYLVEDIPHASSGSAMVEICYAYDEDGVVAVSAALEGQGTPLRVSRQAVPGDMSWVGRSPAEMRSVTEAVTVLAAVDLSGSMSGKPLSDSQEAVLDFIQRLDLSTVKLGIMEFADSISVSIEPSNDAQALRKAVKAWSIGSVGIGNGTHPFEAAHQRLCGQPGRRILVVLTDGCWAHTKKAIRAAEQCHADDIEVIALGFGSADEDFLKKIATSTDRSALLNSSEELRSAFEQIAQVVSDKSTGLGRF